MVGEDEGESNTSSPLLFHWKINGPYRCGRRCDRCGRCWVSRPQEYWPWIESLYSSYNLQLSASTPSILLLLLCTLHYTISHILIPLDTAQQIRFFNQIIKQSFPAHQLGGRVELSYSPPIQYDNTIRIKNCVDAVSDGDDGFVFKHAGAQSSLEHSIGFYIDCSLFMVLVRYAEVENGRSETYSRFVQDKDIGRCEESARERDELALAGAKVGTSFVDLRI